MFFSTLDDAQVEEGKTIKRGDNELPLTLSSVESLLNYNIEEWVFAVIQKQL